MVWSWQSQPFGEGAPNPDANGDGKRVIFNLRFAGQYFDSETGLSQNYFRDYDPAAGRYVQSDPIGLKGGVNTYGYVLQNPLNYIDRFGLAGDGTPGNNQAQNRQINDICSSLSLSKDQRRKLHDEISGCNLGYHEILDIAKEMFCK